MRVLGNVNKAFVIDVWDYQDFTCQSVFCILLVMILYSLKIHTLGLV